MAYGFIDSASLMSAVGALATYDNHQQWDEWTYQSILTVTTTLIVHDGFKIAPGPSVPTQFGDGTGESKLYQCYDNASKALADFIKDVHPKEVSLEIRRKGQQILNQWIHNHVNVIKKAINKTEKDKAFQDWIQWAILNAWVDHSKRLNGLFNSETIDELAPILNTESKDLKILWNKTRNVQQVKLWSMGKNLDSDFELSKRAYAVSAILRSRYHEYIACQMKWQIMHHPLRKNVLIPLSEGANYELPESFNNLITIIVKGAMMEPKAEDRVDHWVANLRTVRLAFHQDALNTILDREIKGDKAVDLAAETARKLNLLVYPHSLERTLEWTIMGGTVVATTLLGFIDWYWAIVGGVISAEAWMKGVDKPLGKRAAEELKLTKGNLRRLADSEPGRLSSTWKY